MMYSEIKLAELLSEMNRRVGNVGRLARRLSVNERTLRNWNSKSEDELHHLHQDSIDQIIRTARDLGIELETFAPPPSLWNFRASYEENLVLSPGLPPRQSKPFRQHKIPFLGHLLNSRFGASASVITSTSARIKFLLGTGIDVVTYKTVRSDIFGSHPPPNIFFCSHATPILRPDGPLPRVDVGDNADSYRPDFGLMNRFGMPSLAREVWQADFRATKALAKEGQLLILSVVPTAKPDDSEAVLIRDSIKVVEYALEAGAEVIEVNCSCPNCSGLEGELYRNVQLVEKICKAINAIAGSAKILLKIGYLKDPELSEFVNRTGPYVHGYSAINTVPVEGFRIGQHGPEPAFGKPKLKAGLSGPPILRFGLSCVQSLARIRERENLQIAIVGIGGAMTIANVQSYIDSGADVVQCASAFFVDSFFGIKVRRYLDSELHGSEISAEEERDIARANWSRAVGELEVEFGSNASIWSNVQLTALHDFQEWEHGQRATLALGPRRKLPIPTVADFKASIRNRLAKPQV
jgi:dihydroorotate dehydrogenase